jgi:anti-anti-sigma regulatory factor
MATIAACLKIDGEHPERSLLEVCQKLDATGDEVILDLSSVRRIDPSAVRAMEKLAAAAEEKTAKILLRGVSIEIYKVLKLTKLSGHFSLMA